MIMCPVCLRVRRRPVASVWFESRKRWFRFCSAEHGAWWMAQQNPEQRITQEQVEAIEASLPDVGAVVGEIGMDKAFAELTRDEALRIVFAAVRAYERHIDEIVAREEIPF